MIGVIADDITGSNDIGVMFSKSGYIADIYSYDSTTLTSIPKEKSHVLIFNTESRLDDEKIAYEKVYQATIDMKQAGATQFFNKTCSVFRGNIGSEFDAMLDALGENFAIIVLGFPANERKTIQSIHYVNDEKLEDSQFRCDPVHPMKESNIVDILQSQTTRKVSAITHEVIEQGHLKISEAIQRMKKDVQYVILDVTNQKDLEEIALAVSNEKVLCGSSALAEEIPKVQYKKKINMEQLSPPKHKPGKGLICATGSLTPQTYEQIEYMRKKDNQIIEFDTLGFILSENKEEIIVDLAERLIDDVNQGINVILHTTNVQDKVEQTITEGIKKGLTNTEISRLISKSIAKIVYIVVIKTKQNRFVIAGGETSGAVCKAFQIKGMQVWEEIQTGLASCVSHTNPRYLFVLKSGSFGTLDFIERAFKHLV